MGTKFKSADVGHYLGFKYYSIHIERSLKDLE